MFQTLIRHQTCRTLCSRRPLHFSLSYVLYAAIRRLLHNPLFDVKDNPRCCVLNIFDRMAAEFDWTSAVGDLNPTVLAIQLNDDPRIAGKILNKIHHLLDMDDRHTAIQYFATSITWLGEEMLVKVFEEPEGLHHVLVGIVSANFFCGYTRDDFLGPYASWVRPMLLRK